MLQNIGLRYMGDDALSPLTNLHLLDVSSNAISHIESRCLGGLVELKELFTDNPALCCGYFLPTTTMHCHAPSDELSSCSDLLAKDFFRMFLWIFAFLSLIGNAGVLCYRLVQDSSSKTGV
jgi:leucine-rich repeat-containing G protein-coupled receptor 8